MHRAWGLGGGAQGFLLAVLRKVSPAIGVTGVMEQTISACFMCVLHTAHCTLVVPFSTSHIPCRMPWISGDAGPICPAPQELKHIKEDSEGTSARSEARSAEIHELKTMLQESMARNDSFDAANKRMLEELNDIKVRMSEPHCPKPAALFRQTSVPPPSLSAIRPHLPQSRLAEGKAAEPTGGVSPASAGTPSPTIRRPTSSPQPKGTLSPTNRVAALSPTNRAATLSPTNRAATLSPTNRAATLSPTNRAATVSPVNSPATLSSTNRQVSVTGITSPTKAAGRSGVLNPTKPGAAASPPGKTRAPSGTLSPGQPTGGRVSPNPMGKPQPFGATLSPTAKSHTSIRSPVKSSVSKPSAKVHTGGATVKHIS